MKVRDRKSYDYLLQQLSKNMDQEERNKIINFVEEWTRLIELGLKDGKKISDVALACYYSAGGLKLAQAESIFARNIVFTHWIYGKELSIFYIPIIEEELELLKNQD